MYWSGEHSIVPFIIRKQLREISKRREFTKYIKGDNADENIKSHSTNNCQRGSGQLQKCPGSEPNLYGGYIHREKFPHSSRTPPDSAPQRSRLGRNARGTRDEWETNAECGTNARGMRELFSVFVYRSSICSLYFGLFEKLRNSSLSRLSSQTFRIV